MEKQKMYLKPEAILKYLTGEEKLHTLITAQNTEVDLVTTDQSLYEALGSVENRNDINLNLLVKLLEVATVVPHNELTKQERKILTEQRVNEIRSRIE
jgi:predicted DNA binding protein